MFFGDHFKLLQIVDITMQFPSWNSSHLCSFFMFYFILFCKCSSSSSVFVELAGGWFSDFSKKSVCFLCMSKFSDVLLLCESHVTLNCSVHFRSYVQLSYLGRVRYHVRLHAQDVFHSPEHLFKLVRWT